MFTITDQAHMQELLVNLSDESHTSLANCILRLSSYGGGRFNVELIPDCEGFAILWTHAETGNFFMHGGLVAHDDLWSVNT